MPKSLFERMGLVESVSNGRTPKDTLLVDPVIETVPPESLGSVTSIYEQAGLSDLSRSIFRAKELHDALPSNMSADDRKNAMLSALKVFGLSAGELMDDATRRKAALTTAVDVFRGEIQSKIAEAEDEIIALEARIDALRQEISSRKGNLDGQASAIHAEIMTIEEVVSWMK